MLAHALSRTGYPADSERIWQLAITKAVREGTTQAVYARRGYAYHLFREGRPDDARAAMRATVDSLTGDDDALVKAVETLKFWAIDEVATAPDGGQAAGKLLAEAGQITGRIRSPRVRARMRDFLELPESRRPTPPEGAEAPQDPP
ncbi:hypothetical protein [Actinoplanes sp. DH11]|uniref:hypothetical protein n=1 Tax=Actinoplanes sp. DH11 TaxID=2857011 RepID=UPI001E5C39DC|nr:hypothetical protein [Actinoplanes sp. DH11]